ncbi:hypothetical protein HJFPF1_03409 [Paramyrothecium foliicola]|nr:hypothetical protein HJFPF1_03409 [Paramyrothecium foliicola]
MNDEQKLIQALGQICWLEVPVQDSKRAQKFYTDIFGWESLSSTDAEEAAVVARPGIRSMQFFRKGEQLNGAFIQVNEENHIANYRADNQHAVSVLASFCVENCAKILEKVVRLGGKTHLEKTEIGNSMGFYARFIDTEGNMVGIWSPN